MGCWRLGVSGWRRHWLPAIKPSCSPTPPSSRSADRGSRRRHGRQSACRAHPVAVRGWPSEPGHKHGRRPRRRVRPEPPSGSDPVPGGCCAPPGRGLMLHQVDADVGIQQVKGPWAHRVGLSCCSCSPRPAARKEGKKLARASSAPVIGRAAGRMRISSPMRSISSSMAAWMHMDKLGPLPILRRHRRIGTIRPQQQHDVDSTVARAAAAKAGGHAAGGVA